MKGGKTKEEQQAINEVLNKGQLFVNFPVMFVIFGLAYLSYYLHNMGVFSNNIKYVGVILAFILGWLVWSFAIVKWRIWAFEKTNEKWHSYLKKEAVKAKMIWPDGHIFEKTEIRSKEQSKKIIAINKRMEQLEIIEFKNKKS